MISDLRILATREALLLDVPTVARATVADRFEQFIITEDVRGRGRHRACRPPRRARAGRGRGRRQGARRAGRRSSPRSPSTRTSTSSSRTRRSSSPAPRSRRPGFDIYCAAERVTDVAARLFGAGAARHHRRRLGHAAHRSRPAAVRRRHGHRHDPARSGHRGPGDQPDQGLLRRPGSRHPDPAPRRRARRAPPGGLGRGRRVDARRDRAGSRDRDRRSTARTSAASPARRGRRCCAG